MIISIPTVQWQDGICQRHNTGYGSKGMHKALTTSQGQLPGCPVCSALQGCGNALFGQFCNHTAVVVYELLGYTGENRRLCLRVGFLHSVFLTATLVIALQWVVIQELWWEPGSTTLPEEEGTSPWKCLVSSWILFLLLANAVWKLSDCITVALSPSQYISFTWCLLHLKGPLLSWPCCFSVCLW